MRVAFFTKCFLEPTHVAIAQVLSGLHEYEFNVFAKVFDVVPGIEITNAVAIWNLAQGLPQSDLIANCDVIHAVYDGQVAFTAFELSRMMNKPFVLSFHGGFDTNVKILKPHLREVTRTIVDRATVVTVVCPTDVARLRQLGVTRPVEILPVPIDFNALPPRVIINSRRLLAVGRLIPKKGFETAIAALSHMSDDFELCIVGTGPEEEKLRTFAMHSSMADRVSFAGYLPLKDTLSAIAASCVLMHPARVAEDGNAEGTPQVILWAQALGIPVVAGDSGSIRDIVEDGITGRIVPPDDYQALAEATTTLATMGRDRDQIVARAKAVVRQHHDLPEVLKSWRSVYARAAHAQCVDSSESEDQALTRGQNRHFEAAFTAATSKVGAKARYSLLYSGNQSVIYVANMPNHGTVLVKLASYLTDDLNDALLAEQRILKEGEALAELNRQSSGLVPQLHYLDSMGRFLVREFFDGPSLKDAVHLIPFADRLQLVPLLWSMCKSLFHLLHKRSGQAYAIRDLKPRNIILTRDEPPRLLLVDVGSARPIGQPSGGISRSRSRVRLGTRNWVYWAPEILLQNGIGDSVQSDFFSFGATVFYALLGRAPFSNSEADPDRALETYFSEYETVIAAWLEVCENLHIPYCPSQFISQCLHPQQAQRPQEMPPYEQR